MSIARFTPDSLAIPSRPVAAPALVHRARPRLGYLQVLAGALLFGVNASVSKVALTAGIEPARLTALRCTGAALGLLAVLGATRPSSLRVAWGDLPVLV